jgi:tetratricopeptide (TPR) repeat protein
MKPLWPPIPATCRHTSISYRCTRGWPTRPRLSSTLKPPSRWTRAAPTPGITMASSFSRGRITPAPKRHFKALDINPDYAEAHNNLGAIYEQQGRLDDAAKEFRQAIEDRPDYPAARFHLGRILVNGRRYDEATRQFLRALSPEDDQTTVYLYALAATYARAGDRAQALAYFQKAHDAAVAHGQSQMLTSIDRDLKTLHDER